MDHFASIAINKHIAIRILVILIISLTLAYSYPTAHAQQVQSWASPISLTRDLSDETGKQAESFEPVLGVDHTGVIHAFWTTRMDPSIPAIGNTIYYARWENQNWSAPVDLFYLRNGAFWLPRIAIDQNDVIHLTWVYDEVVWYSQVLSSDAGMVRSWRHPVRVSDEEATNAAIAVGLDGRIHVVYYSIEPEVNLSYVTSTDGVTWSAPKTLWIGQESNIIDMIPRLSVDSKGKIHVVFGARSVGPAIYYTQSGDNGQTWRYPLTIDQRDERYGESYGPSCINFILRDPDEVHLVWDGPPIGQRWHQWSADGGNTWTDPEQISAEVRGLTGPNALSFDSTGSLHLFTLGVAETGPYYTSWNGTWSPMESIGGSAYAGEGSAIAISGEDMIVAWYTRPAWEIFTSQAKIPGNLNSLTVVTNTPSRITPTETLRPAETETPIEPVSPILETQLPAALMVNDSSTDSLSVSRIILIGVIPAFVLSSFIFILKRNHRMGF